MNQRHLGKILHQIFPKEDIFILAVIYYAFILTDEDIVSNARKETEIKNPSTNYFMEVDIWIPKLKLCFEFQVHAPNIFFLTTLLLFTYFSCTFNSITPSSIVHSSLLSLLISIRIHITMFPPGILKIQLRTLMKRTVSYLFTHMN